MEMQSREIFFSKEAMSGYPVSTTHSSQTCVFPSSSLELIAESSPPGLVHGIVELSSQVF